jgi:hypothetical protein
VVGGHGGRCRADVGCGETRGFPSRWDLMKGWEVKGPCNPLIGIQERRLSLVDESFIELKSSRRRTAALQRGRGGPGQGFNHRLPLRTERSPHGGGLRAAYKGFVRDPRLSFLNTEVAFDKRFAAMERAAATDLSSFGSSAVPLDEVDFWKPG